MFLGDGFSEVYRVWLSMAIELTERYSRELMGERKVRKSEQGPSTYYIFIFSTRVYAVLTTWDLPQFIHSKQPYDLKSRSLFGIMSNVQGSHQRYAI
jgi:hypothetical protein